MPTTIRVSRLSPDMIIPSYADGVRPEVMRRRLSECQTLGVMGRIGNYAAAFARSVREVVVTIVDLGPHTIGPI